jgi:hypothetical protein
MSSVTVETRRSRKFAPSVRLSCPETSRLLQSTSEIAIFRQLRCLCLANIQPFIDLPHLQT